MIGPLLLSLVASAAPPVEPAAPTASQVELHHALAARHFAGCAALQSDSVVADLIVVAEQAPMPPWVSLRAARCLVTHHAESATPHLEAWVVDAERTGLGVVVLSALDDAPLDVALAVARRALANGPDPGDVRRRLGRLNTAELRALAEVTP